MARGADWPNAGSSAAPWQTLQHAVDSVKAGDTILVESGTYAGCRIGKSGQAGAPITLTAHHHVLVLAPEPRRQRSVEHRTASNATAVCRQTGKADATAVADPREEACAA